MKRLLRLTLYAGSAAAGGIILWGAGTASATDDDDGGGSAGAGTGQVQEVVVDNATTQGGTAEIANTQINLNAPVAIASPGANSGGTSQSNEADNTAAVVNGNSTDQSVDQSQEGSATATGGDAAGGGDGGDGTAVVDQGQSADVSNDTDQTGDAAVENRQVNVNVPVAVLSSGANSGSVEQSNEADNTAVVENGNSTDQSVAQSQGGDATASGGDATDGDPCNPCGGHGGDGGDAGALVEQGQAAEVGNGTSQGGSATVDNSQENVNGAAPHAAPAPVPAPAMTANSGGDCGGCQPPPPPVVAGPVDQSNAAGNEAGVGNSNDTTQSVDQSQDGSATATGGNASGAGDGGDATAIVDQDQWAGVGNETDQSGDASVSNTQTNVNFPVAIGSHGANSGPVSQSNQADNTAVVENGNSTDQSVGQSQSGDATASGGDATGAGDPCGCEPRYAANSGGGGGHPCDPCSGGHGGDGGDAGALVVQAQSADVGNGTSQGGSATVDNHQENANLPAPGHAHKDDPSRDPKCGCQPPPPPATTGAVDQSNSADNTAVVINDNATDQSVGQSQSGDATASGGDAAGGSGPCGCGPSHTTFSGGGGVDHPCGCEHNRRGGDAGDGTAIVDQGQWAEVGNRTSQDGSATVDNHQENANGAAPRPSLVRENGGGGWYPATAGETTQSNRAVNGAGVGNFNDTSQSVEQSQDGSAVATGGNASGGGDGGDGAAVVYQDQSAVVGNATSQNGDAAIRNDQRNTNAPASKGPHKDGPAKDTRCECHPPAPAQSGPVGQSNDADNAAVVINHNSTDQSVGQSQAGDATASGGDATGGGRHPCGCTPPPKPPPSGGHEGCGCEHDRKGDHGDKGGKAIWPALIANSLLRAV